MKSNSNRNQSDEPTTGRQASTAQGEGSDTLGEAQYTDDGSGRRLGRFALLNLLGRGGMGEVYLAVHINLRKTVALKVLPSELLSNERAIARFHREVRAISTLSHPNIIRFENAGRENGVPYLVTEYVQGIDLERLIDRLENLPVPEACQLIGQAALGLHHAHQRQLVHRDVKPSNLMLSTSGTVKVLDLGLAFLAENSGEDVTAQNHTIGSIECLAPEQAIDSHNVDARTDVYGLGCTLFKLLTGRAPFAGTGDGSRHALLNAHLNAPPPSPSEWRSDVPEDLSVFVMQMLSKCPADRPGSASDVAANMAQFAIGCDTREFVALAELQPDTADSTGETRTSTVEYLQSACSTTASDGNCLQNRAEEPNTKRRWLSRRVVWACLAAALVCSALPLMTRRPSPPVATSPPAAVSPEPVVVGWAGQDWPSRKVLSRTFSFEEVDLTVRIEGDLAFHPRSDSPDDHSQLHGGLSRPEENLFLDFLWENLSKGATVTLEFSNPVTDVSFTLFDVDCPQGRQDQVAVKGWNKDAAIAPELSGSPANEVSSDGGVITGRLSAPDQGPKSDLGNAAVRFSEPIDKIELYYRPGGPAQFSGNQGIGIHDIRFSIPRPFGPTYTLDWDVVDWCRADRNRFRGGDVDVTFSVTGDIGGVVRGNGFDVQSAATVGGSAGNERLVWTIAQDPNGRSSSGAIDFSRPVAELSFSVNEIDVSKSGWADRFSVVGLKKGTPVQPTVDVGKGATSVADDTSVLKEMVTVTTAAKTEAASAHVRFDQPVDRVMLTFTPVSFEESNGVAADPDERKHQLSIGNLEFIPSNVTPTKRQTVRVVVPATANLWRRDQIESLRDEDCSSPAEWPVSCDGLGVTSGQLLSFDVQGKVRERRGRLWRTPDGGPIVWYPGTNEELSGGEAPVGSLVGVFTGNPRQRQGDIETGERRIPDEIGRQTLSGTSLGEVFFIGDGKNTDGQKCHYQVPPGAEKLYLGVMDQGSWRDNVGFFVVDTSVVEISAEKSSAEMLAAGRPEALTLLDLLDSDRDVFGGSGVVEGGSFLLRTTDDKPAIVQIPLTPPRQYVFRTKVERLQGEGYLGFGLPSAQGRCLVVLDHTVDGSPRSGVVHRLQGTDRLTAFGENRLLPGKTFVDVEVHVLDTEILVRCDGSLVGRVDRDPTQLALSAAGDAHYPYAISLHAQNGEFSFRAMSLTALSGPARRIRFSDPISAPDCAFAEQILWKGGMVSVLVGDTPSRYLDQLMDLPSECHIFGLQAKDISKGMVITDRDVAYLSRDTSLRLLNLSRTRITDDSFVNIGHEGAFSRVERASFASTALGDNGIKALVPHLKSVTWLCLCHTKVTGDSLRELARLETLTTLHLGGLSVDDSQLDLLFGKHNLKEIVLKGTNVTMAGKAELRCHLPDLKIID